MKEIYKKFQEMVEMQVQEDQMLAPFTTYKVGGPADAFVAVKSVDDLVKVVTAARACGIPFFLLGGGSNILVGDKGFRGLVIKNEAQAITVRGMKGAIAKGITGGSVYVEAESGTPFNSLVRYTIEEGLQGLEMHLGLPGSVGGAIFMNSKWMKPIAFVGDVVHQAMVLTAKGDRQIITKTMFQFSYGESSLQKSGDIVLSVLFLLKRADKDTLWQVANESIEYRKNTQPQGVKTAGCVFKNISQVEAVSAGTPDHTMSAGYLIDKAGCKDLRVGDAAVSPLHANFIVNTGKATALDMVQLIEKIRIQVKNTFGITLVEEIRRVGDF